MAREAAAATSSLASATGGSISTRRKYDGEGSGGNFITAGSSLSWLQSLTAAGSSLSTVTSSTITAPNESTSAIASETSATAVQATVDSDTLKEEAAFFHQRELDGELTLFEL